MAVDRSLWKKDFDNLLSWPCPHCQQGSLYLVTDTLRTSETGFSVDARSAMAWTPEWVDEKFSALLICSNSICKEIVSVVRRIKNLRR